MFDRSKCIGASEIAAICGVDPYKTSFDVYMSKVDPDYQGNDNKHTLRGKFLEPAIRQWAEHMLGKSITKPDSKIHPLYDFIAASPDGYLHDDNKVVEIKSPSHWVWKDFVESEDIVPIQYRYQIAQQMAVFNCKNGLLISFSNDDLQFFEIERDMWLESNIIEAAKRFYEEHLRIMVPPIIRYSKESERWLKMQYPYAEEETELVADDNDEKIVHDLLRLTDKKKKIETAIDDSKSVLKQRIADHEKMVGNGFCVTYKNRIVNSRPDWKKIALSQVSAGIINDNINTLPKTTTRVLLIKKYASLQI